MKIDHCYNKRARIRRPGVIIFLPLLVFAIIFCYMLFRGCTTLNEVFGGEIELNQTTLAGNYFYDRKNGTIGKKVGEDHYYMIFKNRIDSLNWNNEVIIGFVDTSYFAIIVKLDGKEWPVTKDRLKTLYLNHAGDNLQSLHNVPGLKGFEAICK